MKGTTNTRPIHPIDIDLITRIAAEMDRREEMRENIKVGLAVAKYAGLTAGFVWVGWLAVRLTMMLW